MKHIHIFGGGWLVARTAEIARTEGWTASLRTSPRLWNPEGELAARLQGLDVAVYASSSLDEVMAAGPAVEDGDLGLSFGAPWLFRQAWIDQWKGRIFNCHGRTLPRHRGAGGASWLILMDERAGRAAIHHLTAGIDDGPIATQSDFIYPANASVPADFDEEDLRQGSKLLADWLPQVLAGPFEAAPQDEAKSSYWPRLSTDVHGWIDWSWTADEIVRFCRAFSKPYAGARTFVRGKAIRVLSCAHADADDFHPFQAGLIYRRHESAYFVAARGGGLRMETNGTALVGDRLTTPRQVLERALDARVTYLPDGRVTIASMLPPDLGSFTAP